MSELFRGKGSPEMREELIDFLDLVFGFTGKENNFMKLHPKLYKAEYHPCENNYIVTEDGAVKAAVGAYNTVLDVNGEQLTVCGIGNVAVHPDSRSKGYMIDCMDRSIADMIAQGIDISTLGGQRQRYMYFSYDKGGPEYRFQITPTNIRHTYRDVPFTELTFTEVHAGDTELIEKIRALHETRPLKMIRPAEAFFDITQTWASTLYAILKNGTFIGYYINELQELTLCDNADFDDVIRNYVKEDRINLVLPQWDKELIEKAYRVCESVGMGNSEQFTVFNFKKVIGTFLRFRSTYETLADGEWTVLIHGYAKDEKLKITVQDNTASVADYDGETDAELDHTGALSLFFALCSPVRDGAAPIMRSWFPLPLFVEAADRV